MNDYIVTQIEYGPDRFLAAALYEDRKLRNLRLEKCGETSEIGKIYLGHVDSYAKNIGGAFVKFDGSRLAFLPHYKRGQGDPGRILLQITKDAAGNKTCVATRRLSIAGRYAVMEGGSGGFSFSKKLSKGDKELLAKWTEGLSYEGMRPLLRTNAPKALKAELLSELETLARQMQKIVLDAEKAKPGTLLYEPEPFYVTMLRDLYMAPDRLWSDIPLAAEKLEGFPHENEEICYTGRSLSLAVLYELGRDIDRLLAKKVWLKSGAYLVIEKTEAFVSIDVNSGRFEKGKIAEETYRKINLEAAEEIVTQVILRNLSGMILVDFIKLSNPDHREELVNVMRKHAKRDRLSMDVVDLTPLGIMEIVREKREKPLPEILRT